MIDSVEKIKLWKSIFKFDYLEDNNSVPIDGSEIVEILNKRFRSIYLTKLINEPLVILNINNDSVRKHSHVVVNDKFYQLKLKLNLNCDTSFRSEILEILNSEIKNLNPSTIKFYKQIEFDELYKEHFKSRKIFESKSGFEFFYSDQKFKYIDVHYNVDTVIYDFFSSYLLMSDYLSLVYNMNSKQQDIFLEAIGFKDRHHPSNVIKKINLKNLSDEEFSNYASVNYKTYCKIGSLYNDKLKSDKLKSDLKNIIFKILEIVQKNYLPVDNLKIFKNRHKFGELIVNSIGSLKLKDYSEFIVKPRNCDLYYNDPFSNKMPIFSHLKNTYYPYQVESLNYLISELSTYLESIK